MDPARELPAGQESIALEVGTRVIADLHLDPMGEERIAGFREWCAGLQDCPRLIVLGDLFDVWVGPSQARLSGSRAVLDALARLTAGGVAVDVVPGNRDFLMGVAFEQATGARLRRGGFVGHLGSGEQSSRTVFVHGDELCTLDLPYQRMKRVLRSGPLRVFAALLPLSVARWAAGRLRQKSNRAVAAKAPETTRMQEDACRRVAACGSASTLVCGHAHRYRDESLQNGPRWIVLDSWGGARDVLRASAEISWVSEASSS